MWHRQFADMGAEVWKVERYGSGDQARTWDPFVNGLSTLYTAYNKNKQSIELDLSSQEGKQVIYDMVKEADVVLENFKSGSIDRLGLGYRRGSKLKVIPIKSDFFRGKIALPNFGILVKFTAPDKLGKIPIAVIIVLYTQVCFLCMLRLRQKNSEMNLGTLFQPHKR